MPEDTDAKLNELTALVKQLLSKREPQFEEVDVFVTARAPETDFQVYPELIEALQSIEEDFFHTPLMEEERNDAIHACLKSSSMNYKPPPLIDSASEAVRKADSTLSGIRVALAQATRPIDLYVQRRVEDTPYLTADVPHIFFANNMRALLSDTASIVTQDRLDNPHKGMDLQDKPLQLVESESKLLMDQVKLDALIANMRPEKRSRIRKPFRGRQQAVAKYSTLRKPDTAKNNEAAISATATNNHPQTSSFRERERGRERGTH
ncbi:hypothetical protein AYI69_g10315 [Smittium culicis]|uniref:Uncharacterized protein n=1 Tax=Smittium culicis TaxID=133412 RepID=A0A1R1X6L0_9FUNG|nr:hypothetical protein AYI69_g10315 [Smittium culicis]